VCKWRDISCLTAFLNPSGTLLSLKDLSSVSTTGSNSFPKTSWTLLGPLKTATDDERREIVDAFLRSYWQPLAAFARWRFNLQQCDVDDLVQSFIADKVVGKHILNEVDRGRGRLRSFLQKSLEHYGIDKARKRSERTGHDPENIGEQAPTPDEVCLFDVQWAKRILNAAADKTEAYWQTQERPEMWVTLQGRSLHTLIRRPEPVGYDELSKQTGLPESELMKILPTAKRSFGRHLREVVGEYTRSEDIDSELADLMTVMRQADGLLQCRESGELGGSAEPGQS